MASLDLSSDVVDLTAALVDIESVSGNEREITDAIEPALDAGAVARALAAWPHPDRSHQPGPGRARRHRRSRRHRADQPATCRRVATTTNLHGLGSCDMKGGVAVALKLAAGLAETNRDVTYVFYECEEVEADRNGLYLVSQVRPELLEADFAVLMEPSNAVVEAGCQGTMRVDVTTTGKRAHSARSWNGVNAIHGAAEILNRLTAYDATRAADRRPEVPRGPQRGRDQRRSGRQRHPRWLHGQHQLPVRARSQCRRGGGAHARGVRGFRPGRLRLRTRRAARARPAGGCGVRRRQSAAPPTRSSAGPTCRGSASWASRRSTSGRATPSSPTPRPSSCRWRRSLAASTR